MSSQSGIALAMIAFLLLASCSGETAKRTTYQSLQIMKQRECQQQPGNEDCPDPESYDKYKKKREEELKQ